MTSSSDMLKKMRSSGYPAPEKEDDEDDGMSDGGRIIRLSDDEIKMLGKAGDVECTVTGNVNEKGELTIISLAPAGGGDEKPPMPGMGGGMPPGMPGMMPGM